MIKILSVSLLGQQSEWSGGGQWHLLSRPQTFIHLTSGMASGHLLAKAQHGLDSGSLMGLGSGGEKELVCLWVTDVLIFVLRNTGLRI